MILFVKEGCNFCQKFIGMKGLTVVKVIESEGALKLDVNGALLDPPFEIKGLPTLRSDDGSEWFVGKTAVEERLKNYTWETQ